MTDRALDVTDKTPPEGPFARHLARIEGKIDALAAREDRALEYALAAHQTAKTALWARASWGPYLVSGLAFALAFATAIAAAAGR